MKRMRSNSCDEDHGDYLPLSKRINSLHLNASDGNQNGNVGTTSSAYASPDVVRNAVEAPDLVTGVQFQHIYGQQQVQQSQQTSYQPQHQHHTSYHPGLQQQQQQQQHHNSYHPQLQHQQQIQQHHIGQQNHHSAYHPNLDADNNPHYYEANRLLYFLHMEKRRRNGLEGYIPS